MGETERRLGDRFQQHRWNVENPDSITEEDREDRSVCEHFNRPGHSVHDMVVSGVKFADSKPELRGEEQRQIAHLGSYRGECMNVDFRFYGDMHDY